VPVRASLCKDNLKLTKRVVDPIESRKRLAGVGLRQDLDPSILLRWFSMLRRMDLPGCVKPTLRRLM
jgi:hypothetical protein